MIDYCFLPEFNKDFKALEKRFRTLPADFKILKQYTIETFHLQNVPTPAIVPMEGFGGQERQAYKIRKIACAALRGRGSQSGLRIVYVYEPATKKVTFIEFYFKGDKENEDRERLKTFLSGLTGTEK